MGLEARILRTGSADLVNKQRLFRMADRVVEVYILSQIPIHIAHKRQEGSQPDPTRNPDLFRAASLIVEHAVGAFNERRGARFQPSKQVTGKISTGFDRETQDILRRCAGDRKGVGFVQVLIARKADEQKLSGALFLDRFPGGAQRYFRAGGIRMPDRLHLIGTKLLENPAKYFRIQIRNGADDEK